MKAKLSRLYHIYLFPYCERYKTAIQILAVITIVWNFASAFAPYVEKKDIEKCRKASVDIGQPTYFSSDFNGHACSVRAPNGKYIRLNAEVVYFLIQTRK